MRCLTLADALKRSGALTRFISRHLNEQLRGNLADKGHEFVLLAQETEEEPADNLIYADAMASLKALSHEQWDWLVVDHYGLDHRWESMLRRSVDHILAIDDIANRQHDCDLLLDQNLYLNMEARYAGKVPSHCQLLLGPRFALLGDEFTRLHTEVQPRRGPVKRVLVSFGGIDANNFTGKALSALSAIGLKDVKVDVVIGAQHPCRKEVEATCEKLEYACHIQTERMAELISVADMAIGAGGISVWERCSLGLPSLVIKTADNQTDQIKDAASLGLLYAPEFSGDWMNAFERHILALIENDYLRSYMSASGINSVHGRGAQDVVAILGCSELVIRNATPTDSKELFNWRNHASIRQASRNSGKIDWQNHSKWFMSVLADPKKAILIGEIAGTPMGVVRFDLQDDEAEISIYLAPEKGMSGRGFSLLAAAESWLVSNYPNVRELRAHVLGDNGHSLRFFSKAGFKIKSVDYFKKVI